MTDSSVEVEREYEMATLVDSEEQKAKIEVRDRPKPGRIIAGVVAIALLGLVVKSLALNERMEWSVVLEYLFASTVLKGVLNTIYLTVTAMLLGIVVGVIVAVMLISENRVLKSIAQGYVWVFRSIPQLVQLLIWYNLAAIYPQITVSLPFDLVLLDINANAAITPFVAALFGLGLNESAYMAEIVRGGINSIGKGQIEAAKALGFTSARTMRRIILPQTLKVIIPPTGNEVISTLKATSLVMVISMADLLYSVQLIYSKTFQTIPLLVVSCIWYLVITSVLTLIQQRVEKRMTVGNPVMLKKKKSVAAVAH